MDMAVLLETMLQIFIYIVLGFIASKTGLMDELSVEKLNKILLYLGQPAIIISSVLGTEMLMGVGQVVQLFGLAALLQLLMLVIGFLFCPIFFQKGKVKGLYIFMTAFGNVMLMGFPVIEALWGSDAIFLAAICSIPFNLFIFSVGVMLMRWETGAAKLNLRFLLTPAFITAVLSIVLFLLGVKLPSPVLGAADGLAAILIPLSMVIIGANMGMSPVCDMVRDWRLLIMCAVKLLAAPLIIWLVCAPFVKNELFLVIIIIFAAMPVAVLSPILSLQYGNDHKAGSRGVFVSTLLSLLTIPLIVYLLF